MVFVTKCGYIYYTKKVLILPIHPSNLFDAFNDSIDAFAYEYDVVADPPLKTVQAHIIQPNLQIHYQKSQLHVRITLTMVI